MPIAKGGFNLFNQQQIKRKEELYVEINLVPDNSVVPGTT